MTTNSHFSDPPDRFWILGNLNLNVPDPTRLPDLVRVSLQRHLRSEPNQLNASTVALEAWVATSCFGWEMRNHLIDVFPKLLPLVDSQQRESLELLLAMCHGWNEAEVRNTRKSLKLHDKYELSKMSVRHLKALAEDLWRRGIGDPAEMYRLKTYAGSGVLKYEVIEGIWKALNPSCPMA